MTYKPRPRWTAEAETDMLMSLDAGLGLRAIGRRVKRRAVCVYARLRKHGIKPRKHLMRSEGMSVYDVAHELGVSITLVKQWIGQGRLQARAVIVIRQRVYTVSPEAVATFIRSDPYIGYQPSADWAPIVAEARRAWDRLYIHKQALADLLLVDSNTLSYRTKRNGFPQRIIASARYRYYDRAAVRAWLDAHPHYWTRAAREKL